ncbi:hypothetical protein RZS28_18565 (plasmid) [Methylocapsa polymorpha]|uniref:Uncharacterized protein n=1 Tax=Methylocapsa polymorpha TaxID=3080828 RepID=A0ABZ0HWT9_9HYPH|nr:hypothetical protein RZS28_18565 [Methylocapsa sp. RX1]
MAAAQRLKSGDLRAAAQSFPFGHLKPSASGAPAWLARPKALSRETARVFPRFGRFVALANAGFEGAGAEASHNRPARPEYGPQRGYRSGLSIAGRGTASTGLAQSLALASARALGKPGKETQYGRI